MTEFVISRTSLVLRRAKPKGNSENFPYVFGCRGLNFEDAEGKTLGLLTGYRPSTAATVIWTRHQWFIFLFIVKWSSPIRLGSSKTSAQLFVRRQRWTPKRACIYA